MFKEIRGYLPAFSAVSSFPRWLPFAFRAQSPDTEISLKHVHQAITTSPALKELLLQFWLGFDVYHFLCQPDDTCVAGPHSKFAPGLAILVIERITSFILKTSTMEDILNLLHSSWLNDDWPTLSRG